MLRCANIAACVLLSLLVGCSGPKTTGRTSIAAACQSARDSLTGGTFDVGGTVTFADELSDFLVIQDGTGAMRIELPRGQAIRKYGQAVEVTGNIESAGGMVRFDAANIVNQGAGKLPDPVLFEKEKEHIGALLNRRVTLSGVVRSIAPEQLGEAAFLMRAAGEPVVLKVTLNGSYDLERFVDANVTATGVLVQLRDNRQAWLEVHVPDLAEVRVSRAAPAPRDIPFEGAVDLRRQLAAQAAVPEHRVRMRGACTLVEHGVYRLRDPSGDIEVHLEAPAQIPAGDVDIGGFVAFRQGQPILEHASLLPGVLTNASCLAGSRCGPLLLTAADVHNLPLDQAREHRALTLRAVVTYSDPVRNRLFVQDSTDGIYVQISPEQREAIRVGERISLTGVSGPGEFAPIVVRARATEIGPAPLPPPVKDIEQIFSGRMDSRWIELDGMMQQAVPNGSDVLATLAWGKYTFQAHILAPPDQVRALVGRRVKLQGACGSLFNGQRQVLGVQLFVPGIRFVTPLERDAQPPFSLPVVPSGSLLQFSRNLDLTHRVHVRGVVALANPSGPTWVADEQGGLLIESHDPIALQPGDNVEAAGFVATGNYGPVLKAATLRIDSHGKAPAPLPIRAIDAARGLAESRLVVVEATLADRFLREGVPTLVLRSGSDTFTAFLPLREGLPDLRPGSLLSVTGICSVGVTETDGNLVPRDFHLVLRSLSDIHLISAASWLTAGRLVTILSVTVLLALAAIGWIILLRKHVKHKTRELTAATEELRRSYELSRFQAQHDALTGLPNRLVFNRVLEDGLARAQSSNFRFSLLCIDLDRFKQVNDTLGHHIGDRLLKCASQRLSERLGKGETLVRMGGDEFAVLVDGSASTNDPRQVANTLLTALREEFILDGHRVYIGASIGAAVFPDSAPNAAELQRQADLAMYHVKNSGKNGFARFGPDMAGAAQEHAGLEYDMRSALERSEFVVHYQSQVEFSGAIAGLEALVRWSHPRLGVVSPAQFIPLAEETGLIIPIGRWVLKQACRQAAAWQAQFGRNLRIAVNVSAIQFAQQDFVPTVLSVLEETGLNPSLLELELTESVLVADIDATRTKMHELRRSGVRFAVDDFGVGYSSLGYLQKLPLDTLKIDRSFVSGIDDEEHTRTVVKSMITLARGLNLAVVAEGVERDAQARRLRDLGVTLAQGYFFGRPVPAEDATLLIESQVEEYAA